LIEEADNARIRIDNVTNYSFGQDDNGKPVVWAAGKAGWYEITPSDRYMTHYNDTIEAIDLFYFMVDQHQNLPPKRQRLGFMIDPFLTEYQKHTDYRIDDDDEAMETIHKHHKFLLKQMIEERESIDWSQTHLWKHLAEVYSDEVETLRANNLGVESNVEAPGEDEQVVDDASEGASESSQDEDEAEDEEAESEPESEEAGEEEITDWTHAIWTLLNILRKSANFSMRHCGIDQLATEFQKHPDFTGNHDSAVVAIERSAEPLLRLMNEAKLRKKFNWSTRTIYGELEATLTNEIADQIAKTLVKKSDKRHRQKSVLRPSGAGKARKRARLVEDSEEEQVGEPPTSSSPVARRLPQRNKRETTVETYASLEDSPSRQLNGHIDSLPELPPAPEAQEMLELVAREAKAVGRQNQTSHLEAFLGQWVM
jgi:hypothetical protein